MLINNNYSRLYPSNMADNKQGKLSFNKEESGIKKDFPELEDLMFRNKQAQRTAKKKKYYKEKNKK